MRLILASTSPYRRMLLERLGLPFEARSPNFNELGPVEIPDPSALVLANALGKARSLRSAHPEAAIIGSDQTVVCDGRVLGKPGTPERAVRQLLDLAGREHSLLTAVAVITPPPHPRAPSPSSADASDLPGPTDASGILNRAVGPADATGDGDSGRELSDLVVSTLRLRPISEREARAYVARENPVDCAGAYKSESLGIALFEHLRGDDPTAIVGLPLIRLCALLRQIGVDPLR